MKLRLSIRHALAIGAMLFALDQSGSLAAVAALPISSPLTAEKILSRVSKAYSSCSSYRDSGAVRTTFILPLGISLVKEKPFKTAFVRTGHFRFEYFERIRILFWRPLRSRYIVWRNGNDVRELPVDPLDGSRIRTSFDLALAGATGVSSGSAHLIPSLIMPAEVGGRRLTEMAGAKRLEDAVLDGKECYRIEGAWLDRPAIVWIDKINYLVRRLDEKREFDNFRTEKVTTYLPEINGRISDQELELNPPG